MNTRKAEVQGSGSCVQRCLRWCDLDVLDRDRVRIIFTLVGRVVAHYETLLLLRKRPREARAWLEHARKGGCAARRRVGVGTTFSSVAPSIAASESESCEWSCSCVGSAEGVSHGLGGKD